MIPRYITRCDQLKKIPKDQRNELVAVCEHYAFRTNSYYLSLINWEDDNDPIRRIIIPDKRELLDWGKLDASKESQYTKVSGLEHKYKDTALLLVTDVCGGYCRYCFRKRLFMNDNEEVVRDVSRGLNYIRKHKEITNVLLTGGDPLVLSTQKLEKTVRRIREIDHVKIIRIGSKIPAFNPYRILNDPKMIDMFKKYSIPHKRIYVITQYNHPNELTDEALQSVNMLLQAGVIVANQTPMLKGINDDSGILSDLIKKLSFAGIPPYYIFLVRPTAGNYHFVVPVEKSLEIFKQASKKCSGLAKRARLIMSHATGKIEIVDKMDGKVYFRYFRAPDSNNIGRLLIFKSNPEALWFDDYTETVG